MISGPGDLKFPTGLAFHPSGYIVVVDRANTLQVFEKTGSFLKEITNVSAINLEFTVIAGPFIPDISNDCVNL